MHNHLDQKNINIFSEEEKNKRWFVTGGAGFIGSHVIDLLVSAGCQVTVYDNLSLSTDQYICDYIKNDKITFINEDLLDLEKLTVAMTGHDIVWHLAANTDIPSGYKEPRIDLDNSVIATWNILEAMTKNNINELLFASTGAVYGDRIKDVFSESSGPLVPLSLYGAGKIACEAFISAYCNLFGIHAWIYRFGNVIGGRTNHGIIYDFINKYKKDKKNLEVLGTGQGEKNYFLVEECIHGMLYVHKTQKEAPFPLIINLGTDSRSKIMEIAKIIEKEMGLNDVNYNYTGTKVGWPGDQPVVLLDTLQLHNLGWYAKASSNNAIKTAARRILGKEKFKLTIDILKGLYDE